MTERGYLGEVLEELRRERGLSLRDLAAQAGLTAGYLSQLESGKQKNPSLEKLRGLAAALGVSITVVRDEPGYIRVSEGSPEDRSHVRSGVPTIREELDEAKEGAQTMLVSEVAAGLQRALGSTMKFWMAREFHHRKALAGKVAIGVDPGAGPDQQAVTIWKVKDRQWTELVPSATLEPGDVMADWRERMAQMEASKSWHQMYQGVPLEREDKPTPMTPKEWVAWQLGGESERRKHGPSSYVTFAHTDNDGNTTELRWAELSEADTFARTIHRARGDQLKLESHRYFSEQEDEPKLDPKKLLQEEVRQIREATVQKLLSDSGADILTLTQEEIDQIGDIIGKAMARKMLADMEPWKTIKADLDSDPRLREMWRQAPMYEAWKAGRADSATDPNGGNLNPYERALALERRRFEWAAAERTLADLQATDPLFKTVPPPPPWLLEAYKPLPRTDAPQPDSDGAAPLGEE